MERVRAHERALTEYALDMLPREVPGIRLHGPLSADERAGIVTFNLPGVHPHDVASLLDREAVAVRAGQHCTQPLHERLGEPASARASFYVYTGTDDIDRLAAALRKVQRIFGGGSRAAGEPGAETFRYPVTLMDDLYRDEILEHYRNPHNFGTLADADATYEGSNPLCGDRITLSLRLDGGDGTVEDVAFTGRGCAISQASASMLTDEIKGKPLTEVSALTNQDVLDNLGIDISPARLKCALLSLETLRKALAERTAQAAAAKVSA